MKQQLKIILFTSALILTGCHKQSFQANVPSTENGEISAGAFGTVRAHAKLSPIKLNSDLRTIIRENDRVQIEQSSLDSVSNLVTIGKGELPYQETYQPLSEAM